MFVTDGLVRLALYLYGCTLTISGARGSCSGWKDVNHYYDTKLSMKFTPENTRVWSNFT